MFEQFGAAVQGQRVTFTLFFPDKAVDAAQYTTGDLPHIRDIRVAGTFQHRLGQANWDYARAPGLACTPHPNGWLYRYEIPVDLPDGFYDYKYFVTFEDGTSRWCTDPCTKYDGGSVNNSGFVVGGQDIVVRPLAHRLPPSDLIIYELMPDDFTAQFRGNDAPFDAIRHKLDYLQDLGVNAIEVMPWTAWPGGGFNWGYEPFQFFSVAHRYVNDGRAEADKLVRLKWLIDDLHARGMHVIMDGVFNHATAGPGPGRGFAYYWLYQNPDQSPFIGDFALHAFFKDLNFSNACTQTFILDVCKYWINECQIDGIRFDYTIGYYRPHDLDHGITKLCADVAAYCEGSGRLNFSMMLEHLTDNRYEAIDDVNQTAATGCWFDPFMFEAWRCAYAAGLDMQVIRVLDTNKDFAPGKGPVTYIENHDHASFMVKAGGRGAWWKTQPYAVALLTSPGAVLLHNGQEYGEDYDVPENGPGRVVPRPLRWEKSADDIGTRLLALYRKLITIRKAHAALCSPNFYPQSYDAHFNAQGYGVDVAAGVVIYHRWGDATDGSLERFIVVLNMSPVDRWVDIPFSVDGEWRDLLNDRSDAVTGFWLRNQQIGSNWGRLYYRRA